MRPTVRCTQRLGGKGGGTEASRIRHFCASFEKRSPVSQGMTGSFDHSTIVLHFGKSL